MSPGEVGVRSYRAARHRLDAMAWRYARRLWLSQWRPTRRGVDTREIGTDPLGFLTPERAEGLRERFPSAAGRIVEVAESALAGRARFFGYSEVELARPIDFSRDPFSGSRWPDGHGKLIDYRHATVGDPKWIWELNRCQDLPLLAQAYLVSSQERFAEQAVTQMVEWIGQQPPGRGIAWSSGFEAAIRGISFAVCFDALRASAAMNPDRARVILGALWQHARWILRDPSTHSSANNHRIGELAGLATIGLLAPELAEAERWAKEALDGLAREAERQILPDGLGAEQAFAYTLFVADLMLLVVALCDSRARPLPSKVTAALERAAGALSAQLGNEEPSPTYGDTDDGCAIRLDTTELREARGVAAALAARFGHPGARRVAGSLDPPAWWFFGTDGADRFARIPGEEAPGNVLLGNGGLVVFRHGRRRVLVDVGPLGYLSLAAHGHADALQVTLSDEGEELVVDPGVGSYFGRDDWRAAFRGTGFHATVLVDGRDQSESGGRFLWTRHAQTRILHLDLDEGVVVAEHDGYTRLADPVRHRRAVVGLPWGPVLICDRLEARGVHRYCQTWPLHPTLDVDQVESETVRVLAEGEPRLLIAFASSASGRVRMTRGETQPLAGWWSPRLERAVPAWVCAWEMESAGSAHVAALLWPLRDETYPDPRLALERSGSGVVVEFHGREESERFVFDLARDPPLVRRLAPPTGLFTVAAPGTGRWEGASR
jgi:hypothetical protein